MHETVGKYGYVSFMGCGSISILTIFPEARQTAPTSGFALLAHVLPIYLRLHAGRVSGLYFRNKWCQMASFKIYRHFFSYSAIKNKQKEEEEKNKRFENKL
jgi:hypothetical protein